MSSEEDTYTDDDRPVQSSLSDSEQLWIMGVTLILVVFICISVAYSVQRWGCFARCCIKKKKESIVRRVVPFLGQRVSQSYAMTWKFATQRYRERRATLAGIFFPSFTFFACFLLYANLSDSKSSGGLEMFFTVPGFVLSLQQAATLLAHEKNTGLRTSLMLTGLQSRAYWCGFYLTECVQCFLTGTLAAFVATLFKLFRNAGQGNNSPASANGFFDLWCLFFAYCLASSSMAAFISTLCRAPSSASQGSFLVISASVVCFMVLRNSAPSILESHEEILLFPQAALTLAVSSAASSLSRYPLTSSLTMQAAAAWLVLDAFLYALLAAYFAQVLPSGDRPQRPAPPCGLVLDFFVNTVPSIKARSLRTLNINQLPLLESGDEEAQIDSTAPSVTIRSLRKTFKGRLAVDVETLDCYENQCAALVGPNGAGKTTLIGLLTSQIRPDTEKIQPLVRIYGRDMLVESSSKVVGLCPQQNVLFEVLTVREHIALFSALKTGTCDTIELTSLLDTFGLSNKMDSVSAELSGGMCRKLQTACAIVGNSRFIILDESCAGLDPRARRDFWNLILLIKPGRTILMTTHSMLEASILGDRVIVLSSGCVLADADATELVRERLGNDIKIVIDLIPSTIQSSLPLSEVDESTDGFELMQLKEKCVSQHISDNVRIFPQGGRGRRALGVPFAEASSIVSALEKDKVSVISVGTPDLNDVFLDVIGADMHIVLPPSPSSSSVGSESSTSSMKWSIFRYLDQKAQSSPWLIVSRALVNKRLVMASREPIKTSLLIGLPIAVAIAAWTLNAENQLGHSGSLSANMATLVIIVFALFPTVGFLAEHVVAERTSNLRDLLAVAGCSVSSYVFGSFLADCVLMAASMLGVSTVAALTGRFADGYHEIDHYRIPKDIEDLPSSLISDFIEQALSYIDDDTVIGTIGIPTGDDTLDDFVHRIEDINDDEVRSWENEIQNVTGIDIDDTWRDITIKDSNHYIRSWATHAGIILYPCLVWAPLLVAFSHALARLHLGGGPARAIALLPILALGLFFLPVTLVSLIDQTLGTNGVGAISISSGAIIGSLCWGGLLLSPHAALVLALAHLSSDLDKYAEDYPPYAATIIITMLEAIMYLAVALAYDQRHYYGKSSDTLEIEASPESNNAPLAIHNLRKIYKGPLVAVESLNLEVAIGETLGLLGVNGSGKSTTIKCIMNSIRPTSGSIQISGVSVAQDFATAAKNLGVLPQHDAVYGFLNAREHCELFAAIRGIYDSKAEAQRTLALMSFDPIMASKPASCLSGGYRRRLATCIALVADPVLVLLDEPSASLDPVSKRHLWSAIASRTAERAIVVTSHDMEEVSALCSRIAILHKGRLRACDTSTQLVHKVLDSEIQISIQPYSENQDTVKNFVSNRLPDAKACPSTKVRELKYVVPMTHALADLVEMLTQATDIIHAFDLRRPSLEDVFLKVLADAELDPPLPLHHDDPFLRTVETCCSLNRNTHRVLALVTGFLAFFILLTVFGAIGGANYSYDDDNRSYDDDISAAQGCHHEKGHGPPCSGELVQWNIIPFFLAVILSCTSCCACCCCLAPTSQDDGQDDNEPPASSVVHATSRDRSFV